MTAASQSTVKKFLEKEVHRLSSIHGVSMLDSKRRLKKLMNGLNCDIEIAAVFSEGSDQEEMFENIDPRNKNLNTGICLSGNKESVEDCLKRPTLEDIYNILTFSKMAKMTSGDAVVWIPDSAYKRTDFGWENVKDGTVIDKVSDTYSHLCEILLPENRKIVRMSSVDFDEIMQRTSSVQEEIESFYGLPKNILKERPELKEALHLNALTMAILGIGIVEDVEKDILVVARAEERHTIEIARKILLAEGRKNKMSLLSPVPIYGIENGKYGEEKRADSMFDSIREAVLYVNADPAENAEKINGLSAKHSDLIQSWVYLVSKASGLDLKQPSDLVEYLDSLRRNIYGSKSSTV